MSQEDVEIARKSLDAFNRRDRAAWLALNDPEVENVPPRDWPEPDPIRGYEAVWDFFVEAQDAWEESSFEYVELSSTRSWAVARAAAYHSPRSTRSSWS
jgi:ketosteroid isomerase-like protein